MNNTQRRHGRNSSRSAQSKAQPFKRKNYSNNKGNRFAPKGRSNGSFKNRGGGRSGGRSGRKQTTFDPRQFINTNPVDEVIEVFTPKYTFGSFEIHKTLKQTIASMGLVTPTPIQDQVIPLILSGSDVVGLAETGTGKTAAFLIPLIHKTLEDDSRQTLILTPTRELALQIDGELRKLSKGLGLFSTICVGGTGIQPQIKGLKRKNHFVIGTPGRVMDLMERNVFLPQGVSTVVLDEADRMLDMGFINDMRKILGETPKTRETLFFSATMSKAADDLVSSFMQKPVRVSVKKREVTNSIEQNVVRYTEESKFKTLVDLLNDTSFNRVLIFGARKYAVERLSKDLSRSNILSESIHGNKTHGQRQRALAKFKSGNARVLVATDVAARGIHVDGVSHVINYDLPQTFEDYVHRIGRTGRGDRRGKALTFVNN